MVMHFNFSIGAFWHWVLLLLLVFLFSFFYICIHGCYTGAFIALLYLLVLHLVCLILHRGFFHFKA